MTKKYKCPYCNYETDNLLVYCIHVIEKHENKTKGDDAK